MVIKNAFINSLLYKYIYMCIYTGHIYSSDLDACTNTHLYAGTYTQTHTNPVFQRAQLPEQHR